MVFKMTESIAVFENEEAVHLLNYFVSYMNLIRKNQSDVDSTGQPTVEISAVEKTAVSE
jgi:hypothetical protein